MISQMETKVLSALGWKLAPATTARFLATFLEGYEKLWEGGCVEEADFLFMRERLEKLADICMLGKGLRTLAPILRCLESGWGGSPLEVRTGATVIPQVPTRPLVCRTHGCKGFLRTCIWC